MPCDRERNLSVLLDHYQENYNFFLIQNLLTIQAACHRFSSFYHEYDLQQVEGNGYRSFVKKCDLYFANMKNLVKSKNRGDLKGYEKLSAAFVKQAKVLHLFREKDESGHKDQTSFHANDSAVIETLLSFTDEEVKPLYTSPGAFWLDVLAADLFNRLTYMIIFVNAGWKERLKLLLNRSYFANKVVRSIQNHDVRSIRDYSNLGTLFPFNTLAAVAKYVRGTKTTYQKVAKQKEWILRLEGPETPVRLERDQGVGEGSETVDCLVIKSQDHTTNTLIFHVHGSGYVAMRPADHEAYLREWSKELGVAVIAADYAKAPEKPFPCGLQDILDVYLSVTSTKGEDIVGFQPKQVIVSGDSAGGNIAMALVFALNEIKSRGAVVKMPDGICLQCPLSNALAPPPSCGQSCLDTFLPTTLTLTVATSYSTTSVPVESRWFRKPGINVDMIRETVSRFAPRLKDPFVNLMAYERWADLAHIPLMIQTGEFDPLLDCSIDIGKKWCGPVTFDILEKMPHTFLIIPTARKEAKLVISRFKQLIYPHGDGRKSETESSKEVTSVASLAHVFHSLRSIV